MVSIAKILVSLAFFCGFGVCQLSEVAVKDLREEVIEAWYMFDNQRLPKEFVFLDKLAELGVLSWRLDADKYETDEELKKIRESRKYLYMDMIEVSPKTLANYEEMKKKFFEEHLHIDEEVRYCLAGSGYFDVRDRNGAWIRIWVKKGGLIVVPAGIYHRFTLDSSNYIKAIRLFAGDPIWTGYYRPDADQLPARRQYVETFGVIKEGVATTHDVDRVEERETLLGCNKCYRGRPNRICLAQLAEC